MSEPIGAFLFIGGGVLLFIVVEVICCYLYENRDATSYKLGGTMHSCLDCLYITPIHYWYFVGGNIIPCSPEAARTTPTCKDDYCALGKVRGNTYYTLCQKKNKKGKCKDFIRFAKKVVEE